MNKIKKSLIALSVAWICGLLAVLFTSAVRFEIPGIADVMGFGSYLLIGTIILTATCYLPLLWLAGKQNFMLKRFYQLPLLLALVANLPLYIILWMRNGEKYFSSEAYLFTLGFFVIAYMFGVAYTWKSETLKNRKALAVLSVLPIITFFNLFDYQILYQDASYGTVRAVSKMNTKRSAHTATLLQNGKVLIAGGILTAEGAEVNNASTEIFDPQTESSSPGASMNVKRAGHTATLLPDGNVLITGGFDSSGFLASAELYVTAANEFLLLKSEMSDKRADHTAVLLQNGKVLLPGGSNGSIKSNQSADLYDPATRTFTRISDMNLPRTRHSGTLLPDGRVLVVGGSSNRRSDVLAACELFDPVSNTFTPAATLGIARNKHLAILMKDGNVLIIGGSSTASEIGGRYFSCEVYHPGKNEFTWLSSRLIKSRFKITNAGDALDNGAIVVGGDGKYIEVYDPVQNNFFTANGNVSKAWMYPTVTTISDNRVLITGGYDANMKTTDGAWIYEAPQKRVLSELAELVSKKSQ
ncbi:MAG: hypothetical protein KIT62_10275 [Cyclobacteriaceae bacterium]|nr:hypothetical protein [Cyclobacteriaceae bacterium]